VRILVAVHNGLDADANNFRNLAPNLLSVALPAFYFHDCHEEADSGDCCWLLTFLDAMICKILGDQLRRLFYFGL
jgi:hypothetical protein